MWHWKLILAIHLVVPHGPLVTFTGHFGGHCWLFHILKSAISMLCGATSVMVHQGHHASREMVFHSHIAPLDFPLLHAHSFLPSKLRIEGLNILPRVKWFQRIYYVVNSFNELWVTVVSFHRRDLSYCCLIKIFLLMEKVLSLVFSLMHSWCICLGSLTRDIFHYNPLI